MGSSSLSLSRLIFTLMFSALAWICRFQVVSVCHLDGFLGCGDEIAFISSTLYYWQSLQEAPVITGQEGSSRCLRSVSAQLCPGGTGLLPSCL